MNPLELWKRYKNWLWLDSELGLRLDVSRMDLPDDYAQAMEPAAPAAGPQHRCRNHVFDERAELEGPAVRPREFYPQFD